MSQEEQQKVIGRAVLEYGEIKQKLAALLSEADRFGKELHSAARYLSSEAGHQALRFGGEPPDLSQFPTASQLEAIIQETLAATKRKRELAATLKEFGSEPKD